MIWADGHYTAEDWTKHLISRVLDMTHGQWLYRNLVVHKRMKDGLTRIEQEELLKKWRTNTNNGKKDSVMKMHIFLSLNLKACGLKLAHKNILVTSN